MPKYAISITKIFDSVLFSTCIYFRSWLIVRLIDLSFYTAVFLVHIDKIIHK